MKNMWFIAIITVAISSLLYTSGALAATNSPTTANGVVKENERKLPSNVKNINDLFDHLISKGIVKNISDLKRYMVENKTSILNLDPKLIDYGFTVRLYTEISSPMLIQNSGQEGFQEWIIYATVKNLDKSPQEISKESFSLVPHLLEKDNELHVLELTPGYIIDSATRNIVKDVVIQTGEERYLGVVFRISGMTIPENVKLRLYDGKDHTDIRISKPWTP